MSDMASSTSAQQWKYGVFISFRGTDTRDNFTSHLYYALCCKQIKTFMDNDLERGEEIEPALLRTIEESRIAVVIFSKNYASSPWCLDELKKILECKRTCGQIVLPVFYHVDPSDVDEQRGAFGNAFAQLERNYKWKMDKVSGWRADLTNAASISGWDSQVTRPESKLVSEIVQFILKNLNHTSLSDSKGLVGIDSRIERLKTVLCIRSSEVRIIGIWGMGGIGKTTIAEAVFNSISSQYESCCFISNVREKSEECGGLIRLREEFLSRVLEQENLRIDTPRMGSTLMKEMIQHKKVLIVLDDVNDVEQVECLIERHDMFGTGSRILVTSRDRQVLKNVADEIYEVEELNCSEARQLFSLTVFKENHIPKDYMGLSIRAVNYARGNPLALKVLGSFLFGRRKEDWENALNKLEKNPQPKIYNMLKVSFDALGDEEKDIFLDIACFFKGKQIDYVERILDGCGFSTNAGVIFLAERCLVTISNGKLEMHDLLQEMAFEIVRQESIKELGKRSRLWSPRDVNQVLTKNLGTEKVEGIFFDTSKIKEIKLSSKAFVGMYNLRLLKIYNSEAGNNCKVNLPDGLKSLSDELRYLQWDAYPLKSLPSNFHPENLVELNLSHSKLRELWKGDLNLVNLIEVNLSNCEHLTAIPDLSKAKNLERLNLQFCTTLKVVPSSVQFLEKLVDLNLRSCTSLLSFPRIIKSKYLKALNFSGCSNLKMYPEITENVTYLNLNETAIKELPQSIGHLSRLVALNLRDCKQLGNLPDSICLLKSVIHVDVSGCSNVTKFPNIPENTRYLYLSETAVEEFPSSVGHLRRISSLDLSNCGRLKNLPSTIHELACLEKLNLSGCSTITEFPNVSCNIKELYLDGTAIEEIPSSIECCYKLVELHLRNCTKFEILPGSICKLKSLEKLNLSGCSQFQTFPGVLETMHSLRYLYLDRTGIKILPTRNLTGLRFLELGNCIYLEGKYLSYLRLLDLKYLRKLNLSGCGIMEVPKSIGCLTSLEALDLSGNDFVFLPTDISKLYELQYLGLRCCMRLESLLELPPRLAKLDAHRCTSLRRVPSSSTTVDGNIFEFIFTNCLKLGEIAHNNIMAYALLKIQLYAKRLYNEISSVAAGVSSFCIPGCKVPAWFLQQNSAASVTIQLLSGCASSELLGFVLCTVVAFEPSYDASGGFQVKCTYHFKNGHADPCILHCYFASCYGSLHERSVQSDHLFFGYDPCLDATKDFWYGKYSEVSVEFSVEDMDNNPLQHCHVSKCGVRELYTQAESNCDFILPYRQVFAATPTEFRHLAQEFTNAGGGKTKRCHDNKRDNEAEPSGSGFKNGAEITIIYNSEAGNNCKVNLPDGLKSLSDELRYLQWDAYPLKSLPSNFHPENLVELNLSHSKLRELWKGDLNLVNLIEVNLSNCEHLTAIPDLSKAKNLERLNLQFCTTLKVVPSSVQFLEKLVDLNLRSCTSLLSFPRIIKSKYLKALNFSGCSNLKMYPEITENVTYLNLNETAIKELPQSIGHLSRLVALNLRDCKQLGNLPDSICLLKSVIHVDVSGCSNVTKFPNIPENTRYLYLSETAVEEFPSSVGHLRRISSLDLSNCGRLKNLPSTIHELACLEKLNLSGCSTITEFPNVSCNIKELYLDGTAIEEIPSSIECCYKLVELHLRNCTKFEILPGSICKLKSLEKLNLSGCSQFQTFPGVLETMHSLRYLYLDRTGIKILPTRNLTGLRFLELGNCIYLEGKYLSYLRLLDLKYLRKLNLCGCGIMEVPKSLGCLTSLEALDLSGNDFFKLPADISKLYELQYLGLRYCRRLSSLQELPPRLAKLDAHRCTSLRRVPSSSTLVDGNIFEFIFTNCLNLGEIAHNNIMAYALLKIQLYAKRLYNEISSVAAGVSSFCFPGCEVPAWFLQQNSAASVTIQLLSGCASSELLGFVLCTVVAFEPSYDAYGGFQVKCTYHFKNGHADPCILHCYFASCYGSLHERSVQSDHLFFGYDPCLDATKDFWYGKYSEVSVEFSVEDMDNNPLQHCHVSKCGVRKLYTQAESYCDFIFHTVRYLQLLQRN